TCLGANCVPPGQPKLRYAVEINPPAGSGLVREQLTDLTTDADGHAALTLGAPAALSGRVYVGDVLQASVSAHISAQMSGDPIIPGRQLVFETDSTAAIAPGGNSFNLLLAPGSYNLRVTTPDPLVPPIVLPVSAMADRTLDIQLPSWNALMVVGGWIYDSTTNGVDGLQVRVVDARARVLSTSAITGPDGRFTVGMSRGPGMFTLRAEPRDAQTLLPTIEQPFLVGTSGVPELLLRLPAYTPPTLYNFHVSARAASGNLTMVAGVKFTFTSDPIIDPDGGGATITFTASATTDAQGTAQVMLIPSVLSTSVKYMVCVQTAPDSDFASQLLEHFTLDQADIAIQLGPRTPVTGTVYGDDGKAVANAVVQAVGTSANSMNVSPASAPTNAAVALTDQNGRFRLQLDPGTYDFEAAPPEGSSYPHWAVENVLVATSEVPVDIHLPPANRINGRVSGPDGHPLGNVDVRVYLITQTGYSRLRGQAHSASDGSFVLVLANPRPH
ncbi:MAG TPA: hypothetical protein VKN99_04735, partial [Polyangia bacterium]|nr:hypothetical protein [Polyangia bacterium]